MFPFNQFTFIGNISRNIFEYIVTIIFMPNIHAANHYSIQVFEFEIAIGIGNCFYQP